MAVSHKLGFQNSKCYWDPGQDWVQGLFLSLPAAHSEATYGQKGKTRANQEEAAASPVPTAGWMCKSPVGIVPKRSPQWPGEIPRFRGHCSRARVIHRNWTWPMVGRNRSRHHTLWQAVMCPAEWARMALLPSSANHLFNLPLNIFWPWLSLL